MSFITYIWTTFVKTTFSKSIIFKVKNIFEPNALKWVIKIIFIYSSRFSLLIMNIKILSNFQNEWCTFGKIKTFEKNKDCPLSKFECFEHAPKKKWFLSNFEHVNFEINGKYSKKNYDNPNYYASLVIFQTYKNIILKNVHSLGWLLWLWFYPMVKMFLDLSPYYFTTLLSQMVMCSQVDICTW
jgi:hypothetical protein